MDMIKELSEMKETVAGEIAEANRRIQQNGGNLNTADIEIIDKLTHSMKSLATTCAMLEAEENNYSNGYAPYYSGRDVREDWTGYSRDNRTGGSYGGPYMRRYSRENKNMYNGYSRNGDTMEHLRAMYDDAPDEQTRMEIRQLMNKYNQR